VKNVEIKARADSFGETRAILRAVGFRRDPLVLRQTDWYFEVPKGRLKLRWLVGEVTAELIFYIRPDRKRPRTSDYERLVVSEPAHMLRLLRGMFTPGVCVRKRRELWLRGGTRVHLDEVTGLGRFVEIEVPVSDGATDARREMKELVSRLRIDDADAIAVSYADLLASHGALVARPSQ
jgi:adenylate cyclase class IV